MAERDLASIEVVDLSTLAGAELPALAALAALEQQAVMVHDRAGAWYGLGEFTHEMAAIQLLCATIKQLGHHIRGE